MRRILILVFVLVVFGIALAFVLENLATIRLDYLFGTVDLPLAAVLSAAIAFGAALGAMAMLPALIGSRSRERRASRKLRDAEQEIGNLRRAPLRNAP